MHTWLVDAAVTTRVSTRETPCIFLRLMYS